MSLLSLPTELIAKILLCLDVKDTYSVKRVNNRLHDIYKHSSQLQYALQCKLTSMDDNPNCDLPISTRLKILMEHENRWSQCQHTYTVSLTPPRPTSGHYEVSDEFILFGMAPTRDSDADGVQSYRIPSSEDGRSKECENKWRFFLVQDLVDFACSIEEHDLLACLSCNLEAFSPNLIFQIHFFEHSTGNPHPLAVRNGIRIEAEGSIDPDLGMSLEISGENLVLVLKTSAIWLRLYVFDWKTGVSKMNPIPVCNLGIIFLRHDLFLHPDVEDSCLHVYHIAPSPATSVTRICRLGLPALRAGLMAFDDCRSFPNPTEHNQFPKFISPNRPFRERPEDALAIFSWYNIVEEDEDVLQLIMTVHRKAIIDKLPSESTWSSIPNSTSTFNSRLDSDSDPDPDPDSSESESQPPIVLWENWGRNSCRWFGTCSEYITISYGQKFIEWNEELSKAAILSFNPYDVQKSLSIFENNQKQNEKQNSVVEHANTTRLLASCAFKSEDLGSLQYVDKYPSLTSRVGMMINGVALLTVDDDLDVFRIYYYG